MPLPDTTPDYIRRLIRELGLTEYKDVSVEPPPEPGVYLCKIVGLLAPSEGFARFDGKNWSYSYASPEDAAVSTCLSYLSKPTSITRYWRGLAKNPFDNVPKISHKPQPGALRFDLN